MKTTYRQGAKGALLDEYERAIGDLQKVISGITGSDLIKIVDEQTTDENCRSVQTVLTHVVHSGYGYATYIHNRNGDHRQRPQKIFHENVNEYIRELNSMFSFTES